VPRGPSLALYAVLTVVCAATISSCGDSASSSTTHANPLLRGDVVSTGTVVHKPKPGTGGSEINDDNPSEPDDKHSADGVCTLVSQSEAKAILDEAIAAPQEAPLGPTCIYERSGAKGSITLVVELADFAKLRSQLQHRRRLVVAGGRRAYCGELGQPTTLVQLSGKRVLRVSAPCAVGARFGAKAAARLTG
jgi:hypothetical protein